MSLALVANSLINIWFTYREHRADMVRFQREQAVSAASKITQFIREIEAQLGWMTHMSWDATPLDQALLDGRRLLRQAPAIAELALIDGQGRERLRIARQAMDSALPWVRAAGRALDPERRGISPEEEAMQRLLALKQVDLFSNLSLEQLDALHQATREAEYVPGEVIFREGAPVRAARAELPPFLRLALPTGIAITIVSSGAVIERAVASATGAGNVAALGFAIKLVTQAAIISQSIWTPLTPMLTASASEGRQHDPTLVAFSIKLVLLVLTLATALIIALREPIVALVLQRGAFTAEDTGKTATLLALHSGSLVGEGLFMVAVAALLSLHDATTRLLGSALFIVAKVALMFALAPPLAL